MERHLRHTVTGSFFTYDGVHNDHHKRDVYGTSKDGEYIPFATLKPMAMIGYVLLSFLLPFFLSSVFSCSRPCRI